MMLASSTGGAAPDPFIEAFQPLAILLATLAIVFLIGQHKTLGKIYKYIPALVFCYFVPTVLASLDVVPMESVGYAFVKKYVLPASLFLLILNFDLKGIIGLGPKAGIMLLAGTAGVVIGAPIAVFLCQGILPEDGYKPLAYLAGSWIGGGANAIALQENFGVKDVGPIVVVDVAVANVWMAFLLYFATKPQVVDRWLKGDASAVAKLERRMEDYHASVARQSTTTDFMCIFALAFIAAWLSNLIAYWLESIAPTSIARFVDSSAYRPMVATVLGVAASFTRARTLEGAGASRIGSLMIYLLVACIGAGADFAKLSEASGYLAIGAIWMLVHITVLLIVAKLIRAPFFFVAVGSKANIGGAASAPVVASAFNPVLAPVGALLAIAGYVLGTPAGLAAVWLMGAVSGK